ncbi:unnamed protein product [Rotaria sordida]|uniref:Uncharacterized protein n=1 Tax=Rotaria sordida TaxID=392033 RepID=A0A814SGJ4_9BILA|nr:unnamed protein product [Rotaria sordida]CAF1147128.1 unnamed protein product [Rotaria sordida]
MSSGRKQQKKRQRQSSPPPPPSFKSHLAQRFQRLRSGQRDLWADDDNTTTQKRKQSKTTNNKRTYITLSDSDEEQSSQRRLRNTKSGKKLSRNHDENINKNTTCLICSILSQLSSYNCCSEHLSILKNHTDHQQQTTNSSWLPNKVMIVPVTDEIIQHYLDPQQIYNLRTQTTSTSITNKKTSEHSTSTLKSLNKSTMTLDLSDIEQSEKNIPKSAIHSSHMDIEPLASTIVIESACSNSETIQPDLITTTVTSSSPISTINTIEKITTIDKNSLQQSPIEMIVIDDTPTDNQQEHTTIKSMNNNKPIDPWIPISDEVDAALEHVLIQIDSSNETPLEFTPTTARRTDTETMAALLPKIPLKQGRFRSGKPIMNRSISNAANEYRPLSTTQSSPLPTSVTTTTTTNHSLSMTTNVEKKSSISCQTSNNSENLSDNRNAVVTSCILTQDETNRHDNIPVTTIQNLHSISVINENPNIEIEIDRLNEERNVTSSTTNERTPARISYRTNPDGTQVRISRPPLPTNRQSPFFSSLRRTSTDVTSIQPNTKQM